MKKILAICLVIVLGLCSGCSSLNKAMIDQQAKQTELGQKIDALSEKIDKDWERHLEIDQEIDDLDENLDDTDSEDDGVVLIDNPDFKLTYTYSYYLDTYYAMFFTVENKTWSTLHGSVRGLNIDGHDYTAGGLAQVDPGSEGKMMITADFKSMLQPETFDGTFIVYYSDNTSDKAEYEFSYDANN